MRIVKSFLFFTALLLSLSAFAQTDIAGQVIVSTGTVQAIQANKQVKTLSRGSTFSSGDTLVTKGQQSSAQVRFTDGTVMALNANSKIVVEQYRYQGNASSDTSVVRLVQGGFRALTGLISKKNPDAYKVETPVSVIGVRGTNYGAVLDKGKLYAGVWKGGIYVKNNAGLLKLGNGEDYNFTQVDSDDTAPVGLLNPPPQLIGQCSARNPDY